MTAKTKHGHKAHGPARGADPGTPHERLNRLHAQPGRPEGAMHGGAGPSQMPAEPPQPAPMAPPMGAGPQMGAGPSMGPPGAGPSTDDEEGEQT
jgi:hypothetical protein